MKNLTSLIFLIVFFTIMSSSIVFLSTKFSHYFDFGRIWTWLIFFAGIVFGMMFGLIRLVNTIKTFPALLYKISAFLTASSLYLLLFTLLIEFIGLFIEVEPLSKGIIVISSSLVIVLLGHLNSFNIRITKRKIPIDGLTKKIRIAHLSDIHLGHFRSGKFLEKAVHLTKDNNPDLVFVTGDLFDGIVRLNKESIKAFKKLDVPIYFAGGNHDVYSGLQSIKDLLRSEGIKVLENNLVNEGALQIVGLDHMLADSGHRDIHALGKHTMKDVLPTLGINKNKPSILLHHSPDGIEYAQKEGIDLYLTGHTHGGQLFPVTLINELIFRFNKGLHDYKGTKILVSKGIGTFGPPVRIGSKSEVIIIDL